VAFNVGVEPYAEESHARGCWSSDFHLSDFGSRKCCPEKCCVEKR
jgi:hypothetical protein